MDTCLYTFGEEVIRKIVERIIKLEVEQESLRRQVSDTNYPPGSVRVGEEDGVSLDPGHENQQLLLWNKFNVLSDEIKILRNRVQELLAASKFEKPTSNRPITFNSRLLWTALLLTFVSICGLLIYRHNQNWIEFPDGIEQRTVTPLEVIPFPAISVCFKSHLCTNSRFERLHECRTIGCDEKQLEALVVASFLCPALLKDLPSHSWTKYLITVNSSGVRKMLPPCTQMISSFQWVDEGKHECTSVFQTLYIENRVCQVFNLLPARQLFLNFKEYYLPMRDDTGIGEKLVWPLETSHVLDSEEKIIPRHLKYTGEKHSIQIDLVGAHTRRDSQGKDQAYEVAVHSPWELPTREHHHYLKLPPSHSLDIAITPRLTYDSTLASCQGHSQMFLHYSQSNCLVECRSKCTLAMCGCHSFLQPRTTSSSKWCGLRRRYCPDILVPDLLDKKITWESIFKHYRNEINEDFRSEMTPMPEECVCYCPPACSRVSYHLDPQLLPVSLHNREDNSSIRTYYREGQTEVETVKRYKISTLPSLLGCFGGGLTVFVLVGWCVTKIPIVHSNFARLFKRDRTPEKLVGFKMKTKSSLENISQTELFMTNSSLDFNYFHS